MTPREKIAIQKKILAAHKEIKGNSALSPLNKIKLLKEIKENLKKLGKIVPKVKEKITPLFDKFKAATMPFKMDSFKEEIKAIFKELEAVGKTEQEALELIKPAFTNYLENNSQIQEFFKEDEKDIEESVNPYDNITDLQLRKEGVFFLDKPITFETVMPAVKWIIAANNNDKKPENLTLVISSNGGALEAAFSLIDAMKISKIPVHTIGMGTIKSCGLLITMAGEKGERSVTENTSVLSHQWRINGLSGTESDLKATQAEFKNLSNRIVSHYQKTTDLSAETINKELLSANDKYLTASEAIKYGLVDKIEAGNNFFTSSAAL